MKQIERSSSGRIISVRSVRRATAVVALLAVCACASTPEPPDQAIQAAELAIAGAERARLKNEELQRSIAELQARETDRGLVVTLGDLLFATGKSDLEGGAAAHLGKLAAFLDEYQDRSVLIEGHTDSVGSDDSNMRLSQRRADSVRAYLVGQGVERTRISTAGMGEQAPVAGNDTSSGRQQNRRVEVIILNKAVTMR